MELLIPGLILVALMIYASTRIKKSAALAYEPETIETDDFVIDKPAGFLTVIGGDPGLAFESYSREFGQDEASEFRKATANISVFNAGDPKFRSKPVDEIVSDVSKKIGGQSYRVTEAKRSEKNVDFRVFRKSGEKNGRIVRLEIVSLSETTDELLQDIESMLLSFELK